MSAPKSNLEKSVDMFSEKKNACLAFARNLLELKKSFDSDFPARNSEGRLSVEKITGLINRLEEESLKILVAGQFKTGKSTLLNAILGRELLPADVVPCTAVITEIAYGEKPSATLFFKEKAAEIDLPQGFNAEVKNHLAASGPKPRPMEIDISKADALADYLAIPLGLEQKEGVRETPYAKCLARWPLELCRGGAIIIDSPGLNEHESRDAATMSYLEQADMIIHVLNAQQLCGMPDKKFIDEVRARGNARFPIIFVVNRFDQVPEKSRQKLRDYAWNLKELDAIYGREGIFFTSAQSALEGRLRNEPKLLSESGLPEVEKKIAEVFEKDRMKIKLGHMAELASDLRELTLHGLPDLENLLNADEGEIEKNYRSRRGEIEELEGQIRKIRNKVDRGIDRYAKTFKSELKSFFQDFIVVRLPRIVEETSLDIDAFNREESQLKARDLLNGEVYEAMNEAFRKWRRGEASRLEKEAIEEISADIVEDLRDFNADLDRLRKGLGLRPLDFGKADVVGLGDYLPEMLAGAGIGGAVGGAAVFVAGRFLPIFAGPAGWAIAVLTAIASIYLLMDNERARKKFRDNYLAQASRGLRENLSAHVDEVAGAYVGKFREGMEYLYNLLQTRIEDARKPVEAAIAALGEDKARLERKKSALAAYVKKFNDMDRDVENIMRSL